MICGINPKVITCFGIGKTYKANGWHLRFAIIVYSDSHNIVLVIGNANGIGKSWLAEGFHQNR